MKLQKMKSILIISYMIVWTFSIMVFWLLMSDDLKLYSLVFLSVIIPLATYIIALLIGRYDILGKYKWYSSIGFGMMYMLLYSLTVSIEQSSVNEITTFSPAMMIAGVAIALLGTETGYIFRNQ